MPTRPAVLADLPALVALENEAFASDRLSKQSLRYYISAASAGMVVIERRGTLIGYSLVAFRKGSPIARLHSIAVGRAHRGLKAGARLLQASERLARARGVKELHLEVRSRNRRAIGLYESRGYRRCDRIEDYYEDGATALCYEKRLRASSR
jgi:[ribosomal protein S18]-alanine N-acetyltransferase